MSLSPLALQIGLVAGTLTTVSFVPQVIRSWQRRSVEDLSTAMLVAFSIGVGLWIVYGVMTEALPVIVSNGITLVLAPLPTSPTPIVVVTNWPRRFAKP